MGETPQLKRFRAPLSSGFKCDHNEAASVPSCQPCMFVPSRLWQCCKRCRPRVLLLAWDPRHTSTRTAKLCPLPIEVRGGSPDANTSMHRSSSALTRTFMSRNLTLGRTVTPTSLQILATQVPLLACATDLNVDKRPCLSKIKVRMNSGSTVNSGLVGHPCNT